MKKLLFILSTFIFTLNAFSQDENCFIRLENAFKERGSFTVSDDVHENVIICFFNEDGVECVGGKVRVENGAINSVFLQFEDNSYELMNKKFYSAAKRAAPQISNGISEMAQTVDGEKFRVVFIRKLKPKKKAYKQISLPDDL